MFREKYFVIILTVIVGGGVLWLDRSYDTISITPLFSLSWLMLMAFFHPGRVLLGLMLILFFYVVASLQDYPTPLIYIRTLSFCVGGTLAMLFAGSRERSHELLASTIRIIEGLPAMVVAADANGSIIAASKEASKLVEEHYNPLIGHHFSDVFLGHYSPGDAVRIYFEWLQGTRVCDEEFQVRRSKTLKFTGRLMISGNGKDRILTAVLNPISEQATVASGE